jgi:diguanylate cyclase (GGDEF)-like protein
MELKRYIRIILRGWWLILLAILISVGSALLITYNQTRIYRTSATFVISPSASLGSTSEVFRSLDFTKSREGIMTTYVEIVTSNTILGAVYEEMELTEAQREHLYVEGEIIPSSNVIRITVEADDPLIAKTCADLVGQKTIEYTKTLYEVYDLKPLDPAYVSYSPVNLRTTQNLIVAALLGSVVGVGSAFLLHYLRAAEEEIAGFAVIDTESGVYNRPYFLQRLGEELSRSKRRDHPLSVVLMRIEHLDRIADDRHDLRTEALRRVGLFLKQHLRQEDLVARFEGHTFALLFPETAGLDTEQILKKLQTRMAWSVFELEEGSVKLNLTATSGIAAYHSNDINGASREEILAQAESALQRARDDGYGGIRLFDEERVDG